MRNKFWVLVITRDPPANAQCISVDSEFWGSDPLTGVFFRLANVPVLFVGCLVSDKLYSKLKRLLGIQVGGAKVQCLKKLVKCFERFEWSGNISGIREGKNM